MKLGLLALTLLISPSSLKVDSRIDAFYPVPKTGCPAGYYEVQNAFYDGLNYHPACWSDKLTQITKVESKITYETVEVSKKK